MDRKHLLKTAPRSWRERADLLEERRGRFLHLLQVEGGKTIDDAVAEVREAADFCRYYASEARRTLGNSPEGKACGADRRNKPASMLRGRGVFAAISPWNFPLAIFLGQVTAALGRGQCGDSKTGRADACYRI